MNTAPKLQHIEVLRAIQTQYCQNDKRWFAAIDAAIAALAQPSGEGVDAFSVMRSAFVTSESCGPEGDYRLVFRFRSLEALQQAHREWVGAASPPSSAAEGNVSGGSVAQSVEHVKEAPLTGRTPGCRVATGRGFDSRQSPPIDAAEQAKPDAINLVEIDSKLIPDAAEQDKPDEGPRCYQCMQKVSVLFSDGRCVKCTREVPACGCYPPCDGPCHVEQAKPDDCPFCGHPQHYTDEDCPILSRAHTTAVAEQAQAGELPDGYLPKEAECSELAAKYFYKQGYDAACRLAGGVTVDDAMVERLAKYIYQQEARKCSTLDAYSHHMKGWPRALPEARAMLVAALGAKP